MQGTIFESWSPNAIIGLLATLGGLTIALIAVVMSIGVAWSASARCNGLKKWMIERGMSAAEIDLVMRAGTGLAALAVPLTGIAGRHDARIPLSELVDAICSYQDNPEPDRVVRALRETGALDPLTLTVAGPTAEVVLKLAQNGTSTEQLEAVVLALPSQTEPALASLPPTNLNLEVRGEHLMR